MSVRRALSRTGVRIEGSRRRYGSDCFFDQTQAAQRSEISDFDFKFCVHQPFGLSNALVRNWSSLFLNRMLNVVSDP
jgi:hypothetical protein